MTKTNEALYYKSLMGVKMKNLHLLLYSSIGLLQILFVYLDPMPFNWENSSRQNEWYGRIPGAGTPSQPPRLRLPVSEHFHIDVIRMIK